MDWVRTEWVEAPGVFRTSDQGCFSSPASCAVSQHDTEEDLNGLHRDMHSSPTFYNISFRLSPKQPS